MLAAFPKDRRSQISTVAWVIVGVVAWCLAAVVVAVVVGRMISRRDRQRPVPPSVDVPGQRKRDDRSTGVAPESRPALTARLTSLITRRR
jgi:hypothetical protein